MLAVTILILFPLRISAYDIPFSFVAGSSPAEGSGSLFISVRNTPGFSYRDKYSVSIDGGEIFIPMDKGFYRFGSILKGSYNIMVMKNDDRKTVSHVRTAYVSPKADSPVFFCESTPAEGYMDGSITLNITNQAEPSFYISSADGGKTWQPAPGGVITYSGLKSGSYYVLVREAMSGSLSDRMEVIVPPAPVPDKTILRAPMIKQNPELPTGCEVTSLAMALKYNKLYIDKTVLADYFLEKGEYRKSDYHDVFVGDPRQTGSYGCYAGVIVNCAQKYLNTVKGRSFEISDLTGCSPRELYHYISLGCPLIVWATSNMVPPGEGASWEVEATGETITWVANEHCLLLTGYDMEKNMVYLNDPQLGSVAYPMKLFEKRFRELGKQAIAIVETDSTGDMIKNDAG